MAIKKDITVDQGADYTEHVLVQDGTGTAIDLVAGSYTARLHVKRSYKDSAPIILDLTTENSKLVLHDSSVIGRISIVLPDADSIAIAIANRTLDCVYDWELIDGTGKVTRIYEGAFTITKNLTV